ALLGGAFARLLWLVVIGGALYLASRQALLFFSLWVFAFSQMGTAVNKPAWVLWMAGFGREGKPGPYFWGCKAALGTPALFVSVVGGYFLDVWKDTHPHGEMDALRMLFAAGVVCGVPSLLIQARIYEPPLHEGNDLLPFRQRQLLPFRDTN